MARNPEKHKAHIESRRAATLELSKRWNQKNRARLAETRKRWDTENREHINTRQAAWRERNRELQIAKRRERAELNRERLREQDRAWKAANPDKTYAIVARRRARKMGDGSAETVDRGKVYRRDGGICQLCQHPVDKSLKGPHPLSRSLDHVIPLSLGGGHTYANVQLAHLICNVRKGNDPARPIEPPVELAG